MSRLGPAGTPGSLRAKTYRVIFESEPGWGRRFDAALIAAILGSVIAVMLESVTTVRVQYGPELAVLEWAFTILFSLEYVLRMWCLRKPTAYTFSFFGIVDLLSVVPTYLSLFLPGGQFLAVVRVLRVVRVFRVFKLARYTGEANVLATALRQARYKIVVFLVTVISIVIVVGSLMYVVEGPQAGYTSIPRGMYWAIVTLTTVGFGDITPQTPLGQLLASFVMILGYGIIAVPTGIVTAELAGMPRGSAGAHRTCGECEFVEMDVQSRYCSRCGAPMSGP